MASWPNATFDMCGMACGFYKVPLWIFLTATIIGKAVNLYSQFICSVWLEFGTIFCPFPFSDLCMFHFPKSCLDHYMGDDRLFSNGLHLSLGITWGFCLHLCDEMLERRWLERLEKHSYFQENKCKMAGKPYQNR